MPPKLTEAEGAIARIYAEEEEVNAEKSEGSVINCANIVDGQWCQLSCRSIRIGNYKVLPKEKITITAKGVQIKVPPIINRNDVMTVNIPMSDVLKVLAHIGKTSWPLLFLHISPAACNRVRKTLRMTNSQSFFLDVQSNDETQTRITIIPERLTEGNKAVLKANFGNKVQELEAKDANEILVRSLVKDKNKLLLKNTMGGGSSVAGTAVVYGQPPFKASLASSSKPGVVEKIEGDKAISRQASRLRECRMQGGTAGTEMLHKAPQNSLDEQKHMLEEQKQMLEKQEQLLEKQKQMLEEQKQTREKQKQMLEEQKQLEEHIRSLVPECPVCYERMNSPMQIYTCWNGHVICSVCKVKVEETGNMCINRCGAVYAGRATAMEQMISKIFGIM